LKLIVIILVNRETAKHKPVSAAPVVALGRLKAKQSLQRLLSNLGVVSLVEALPGGVKHHNGILIGCGRLLRNAPCSPLLTVSLALQLILVIVAAARVHNIQSLRGNNLPGLQAGQSQDLRLSATLNGVDPHEHLLVLLLQCGLLLLLLGESHDVLLPAVMQMLVGLVDCLGVKKLLLEQGYQLVHGGCQNGRLLLLGGVSGCSGSSDCDSVAAD